MPLQNRRGIVSDTTSHSLLTTNTTAIENVNRVSGDLGLVRPRIDLGDTTFGNYSYGSIIMDGVCNTTRRTGGFPTSGYNSKTRVNFPAPNGTGYTFYVASSDTGDNSTSTTGARKVYLEGLGGDWMPLTEEVTLNGQTPVATSNSTWLRINKMFVSSVGTNGTTNLGHITVMATNDFTTGLPNTTNPVNLIPIAYGYSVIGIVSTRKDQRLYFTRGSYYTDATASKPIRNIQEDTYPWDSSSPDTNRIKLLVGNLYTSTTIAFNTSGSAPEFPATDIEFTVTATTGTNNYSIYWNTVKVLGF